MKEVFEKKKAVCLSCKETKECNVATYAMVLNGKLARIDVNAADGALPCALCDDCVGKTPRGYVNWVFWMLFISIPFCVFFLVSMILSGSLPGDSPLLIAGALSLLPAGLLSFIGAYIGLEMLWGRNIRMILMCLIAGTHIPTVILLLGNKKMRRNGWIDKQFKDKASVCFVSEQERLVTVQKVAAEAANKDESSRTDEEKAMIIEQQKIDENTQIAQEAAEKQETVTYRNTIIKIAFTVLLGIFGFYMYSKDGVISSGYISPEFFMLFIGGNIVYDVYLVVKTRKKFSK